MFPSNLSGSWRRLFQVEKPSGATRVPLQCEALEERCVPSASMQLDLRSVTHDQTANVASLLGNGDGSFRTQTTFAFTTDHGTQTAMVADLNGDRKADLVLVNEKTGKGEVMLGNGDGTFHMQQTFTFSPDRGLQAVAAADVNGDGKADLIFVNQMAGWGLAIQGNSDGMFRTQQTFTFAPDHGAQEVSVADLNGDGKADLVFVDRKAGIGEALLGDATTSFRTQVTFTFAPDRGAQAVTVADLNGDGKADLVIVDAKTGKGEALLGVGDGTFHTQATFTFAPDRGAQAVAVADLNGDGKADLLLVDAKAGKGETMLGIGDATFKMQQTFTFAPDRGLQSVALADLNGDGKLDLVLTGR